MSKFQVYQYKEGEVNLSFQFEEKESIKDDKRVFIKILKQASSELEKELT